MMIITRKLFILIQISSLFAFSHSNFLGRRDTKLAKTLAKIKLAHRNSLGTSRNLVKLRQKRSETDTVTVSSNDTDSDYYESEYEKYYVGPVCSSIFVSYSDEGFKDLENCVIVDGFVWIYFLNDLKLKYDLTDPKYSFPKLRVITEYLLLYRVLGLTTLNHLFPNLVMIRGQQLFYDKYAIVIYESLQLANIGLDNLKFIQEGGIRLQKNPKLCYTSTVDWARLGKLNNNIDISNPEIKDNDFEGCVNQCGNTENACSSIGEDGVSAPYCWGLDLCQKKVCPSNCSHACSDAGECTCDPECLAGCTRPNDPSACHACRNFYYNHTCYATCPGDTLRKHDWLCVTKEKCDDDQWIRHEGQCVYVCPTGHVVITKDGRVFFCELCKGGVCQEVCENLDSPYIVDSVEKLNSLQGCTTIPGQLVITITRGSDMVQKLEEVLGGLQEVGALVVKRSFALVSLSFLKNLRRIIGTKEFLVDNIYSLFIWDNQNLRDLWNFGTVNGRSNLTIGGGKAFFHYNQYLCLDKIDPIRNLTKLVEDEKDISLSTNGDRTPCQVEEIVVDVKVNKQDVKLTWRNPFVKDYRTLIGYQVFFMESKTENATRYHGADACGRTSWLTRDVEKKEPVGDKPTYSSEVLPGLKYYTKYAYYVVMSTTMTAKKAAQSNISYFTTAPGPPSSPKDVVVTAVNYSSISAVWQHPDFPNGNITHYFVRWQRQPDDSSLMYKIDTCIEGQLQDRTLKPVEPKLVKPEPTNTDNQECCSCEYNGGVGGGGVKKPSLTEIVESQSFEDFLINKLIHSRVDENYEDSSRKKRSASLLENHRYRREFNNGTLINSTAPPPAINNTELPTESPGIFSYAWEQKYVYGNNITLTGLHHFSEYNIEISACNHAYKEVGCGSVYINTKRTQILRSADVIPPKSVRIVSKNDVRVIVFKPPKDPNGFIIKYKIQQFIQNTQTNLHEKCCSVMYFYEHGHCELEIEYLSPGKYEARIQPISVADAGLWSPRVGFKVTEEDPGPISENTLPLVLIIVSLVIIAIIGLVVLYFCRKRYLNSKIPQIYASVNPEYSSIAIYEPDEYEIAATNIELLEEIGQGHFGKVFKGLATEVVKGQHQTRVAVKTLHGNESLAKRMEFLKEASVMKVFNSHHVVRLLGVVSLTNKPMVVMEFMARGDLKSYLRCTRPDAEIKKGDPPTLQEKLQMCGEIADGMAYLAETKYVHRDLAARNCLVHNNMTVKIGDFGLTRDVYETDYYRVDTKGILPVRWMAPESLKDGVFDSRSDVWSYGIVLWEIATLAEQPYQGQQHDQVTRYVIDGGYMEQPKECPKKIYDLMLMCWHYSPAMRPTFLEIVASLSPDLSDDFKQVSFFHEAQPDEQVGAEEDNFLPEQAPILGDSPGVLVTADIHGGKDPDPYLHLNGGQTQGDIPGLNGGTGDSPIVHRTQSTIC